METHYHPEGRVVFENGSPSTSTTQYNLLDHLGNTVVLFEDRDGDGLILTETMSTDPSDWEVLQRQYYYPFGMPMQGVWQNTTDPRMDYLYNGKELEEELSLHWLAYGFRHYDPVVGRFTGVDPIADQFAWVSGFNYAENSPIANIDLWGLQAYPGSAPNQHDLLTQEQSVVYQATREVQQFLSSIGSKIDEHFFISGKFSQTQETGTNTAIENSLSLNFKTNFGKNIADMRPSDSGEIIMPNTANVELNAKKSSGVVVTPMKKGINLAGGLYIDGYMKVYQDYESGESKTTIEVNSGKKLIGKQLQVGVFGSSSYSSNGDAESKIGVYTKGEIGTDGNKLKYKIQTGYRENND